jgi:dTDP-4-dehydrorhamnose 3,5-epimerase
MGRKLPPSQGDRRDTCGGCTAAAQVEAFVHGSRQAFEQLDVLLSTPAVVGQHVEDAHQRDHPSYIGAVRLLSMNLEGPILIEPVTRRDGRGFFVETYRRSTFAAVGIDQEFVQHNQSRSRRGIVRGMHFQPGMGKLVRCARGSIFDVLVDIRRASSTFGQWEAAILSDENHHQLFCPDGFAHGFCVLSELADVVYGCTTYYDAAAEAGFRYDDPEVGIEWPPGLELRASPRDATAPALSELASSLPFTYTSPASRR